MMDRSRSRLFEIKKSDLDGLLRRYTWRAQSVKTRALGCQASCLSIRSNSEGLHSTRKSG